MPKWDKTYYKLAESERDAKARSGNEGSISTEQSYLANSFRVCSGSKGEAEANSIVHDEILIEHMKKKTSCLILSGLKFFSFESKSKEKGCTLLPSWNCEARLSYVICSAVSGCSTGRGNQPILSFPSPPDFSQKDDDTSLVKFVDKDKTREVLNLDEEMKNLPKLLMVEQYFLFSEEGKAPTALEDILQRPTNNRQLCSEPDVFAYTAMIKVTLIMGLCKGGEVERGYELFREMKEKGILIDRAIYRVLVDGFVGKRVTVQDGLGLNFATVNPMLVCYAEMGRMDDFCKLLEQMKKLKFSVVDDLEKFFEFVVGKEERIMMAS
ncbi:hypothetical protein EZV62_017175 [Acer yangbiense]|uniref:Pentacotripeptide-repeat region of PRORP domain-containing protein n=1 Tax=Acer yangbiense TaxID=1000413 RepID=A0A5C7HHL5_9ROSI|nr:hypothetical protein EZV62_017175 [Acer yangbiense]